MFPRDARGAVVFKAGRYFVRGRGPDYLLEGSLDVPAGSEVALDVSSLSRVDDARMVRREPGFRRARSRPFRWIPGEVRRHASG